MAIGKTITIQRDWTLMELVYIFLPASIVPGTCLIGVTLSGCDSTVIVALMIVATMFYGTMFAGVFSNHTDIASNYAGMHRKDKQTNFVYIFFSCFFRSPYGNYQYGCYDTRVRRPGLGWSPDAWTSELKKCKQN